MIRSIDKQKVQQAFNRAVNYDQHAEIQKSIGQHSLKMLAEIPVPHKSIIDFGCGTGFITQLLFKMFPCAQLYAIDFSETLLMQARNRLKDSNCVMMCEDFDAFNLQDTQFDLAFSNMALHWSSNLIELFCRINTHLTADGYFVFSIPTNGTFQELSEDIRHQFYQSEEILSMLSRANFSILAHQSKLHEIKFDDWRAALGSIKQVGATTYPEPVLHSKNKRSLLQNLCSTFRHDPQLSYQIDYFIARPS